MDGIATYLGWRRRTVEIHGGAHRVNCSHSAQSAPFESEMWTYLELKHPLTEEINIRLYKLVNDPKIENLNFMKNGLKMVKHTPSMLFKNTVVAKEQCS